MIRFTEFFTQIKRDVHNSFFLNRYKYLLTVIMFLLFCLYFEMNYNSMVSLGLIENKASFGDVVLFVFSGMKEHISDPSIKFEIPITWLSCQLFITYLVGDYISRDMTTYGHQYIMRATHKSYWLIGKVIYCIFTVFCFYLVGYATIWLYTLAFKSPSLFLNYDVCGCLSLIDVSVLNISDYIVGVIVLPIFTSVVLAVAQTILTLWLKPIYSMICVITYVCASAYYLSYYLIGNYSMILRSKKIIEDSISINAKYIDPVAALIIDGVLVIILFFIGILKTKKYDYIEKS